MSLRTREDMRNQMGVAQSASGDWITRYVVGPQKAGWAFALEPWPAVRPAASSMTKRTDEGGLKFVAEKITSGERSLVEVSIANV